ncbi:MAG: hypothetical protein FJ102_04765 [Deltaproteobacteria bacterium]|nr:hypothetical protein [Deltaproteobacteria bacterium]
MLRQEWAATWHGHKLRLIAGQNNKELWVDGQRVAQKTTLSGMGTTLSWTKEEPGEAPVVFTATIRYAAGAAKPVGRLYANGQWIGGSAREEEPGGSAPDPGAAPQADPGDARWEPAKRLLEDLRRAKDPRANEAAARIEEGLRDVLGRLDRLAEARQAHAALGGSQAALDAPQARLDAQAQEVFEALREFHLVVIAGGPAPSLDRVEDLLRQAEAEAEVEESAANRARAGLARRTNRA